MEIFNGIDKFSIIKHLITFLLVYVFYRFILKVFYPQLKKTFESDFKRINNNKAYFVLELFYTFFGLSFVISFFLLYPLLDGEDSTGINIYIATLILAFLYCLKHGGKKNENK